MGNLGREVHSQLLALWRQSKLLDGVRDTPAGATDERAIAITLEGASLRSQLEEWTRQLESCLAQRTAHLQRDDQAATRAKKRAELALKKRTIGEEIANFQRALLGDSRAEYLAKHAPPQQQRVDDGFSAYQTQNPLERLNADASAEMQAIATSSNSSEEAVQIPEGAQGCAHRGRRDAQPCRMEHLR
jgi:hypothetical protein